VPEAFLARFPVAALESSQHRFLGAQTGKHLLPKQNVSEKINKYKSETFFVSQEKHFFA